MDPVTLGFAAVGLGMQIFGGFGASETAEKQAQVSSDIAHQEQLINNKKQQAMELDARRQSLEIMRRGQQAASLAQSRATNQGASFGSGLQGGLAEVQDMTAFNLMGVNNALQTGRDINDLNSNISQDKMQLAQLGGDAAKYAGWSSLGGAVIKAGPIAGQLSQGFGGSYGGLSAGNAFNNSSNSNYYGPLN